MAGKIISKEKESFVKRSFKGIGYWFLGNFMCFFVCSTMIVLMKSLLILKVIIAFCTSAIMLGLFFNWSYYAARRDKNAVKFHNMEYDKYMPLKMAVIAPIVPYIMLILLYLCKAGVIQEAFMSIYLLLDIWVLPFITLFTGGRTINDISWSGMAGITLIMLLQPLTIYATYFFTYNDIDVMSIIFYKKDKNK
ncbi:MAG: hypothetical protein ACI4KG_05300 [Oscillospiraceae bacterium]